MVRTAVVCPMCEHTFKAPNMDALIMEAQNHLKTSHDRVLTAREARGILTELLGHSKKRTQLE